MRLSKKLTKKKQVEKSHFPHLLLLYVYDLLLKARSGCLPLLERSGPRPQFLLKVKGTIFVIPTRKDREQKSNHDDENDREFHRLFRSFTFIDST